MDDLSHACKAAMEVLAAARRDGIVVRVGPRTVGGPRPTVSGHATQALLALGLVTSTHEPGRRRGVYVLALVAP